MGGEGRVKTSVNMGRREGGREGGRKEEQEGRGNRREEEREGNCNTTCAYSQHFMLQIVVLDCALFLFNVKVM